jgi:hypothetical protein
MSLAGFKAFNVDIYTDHIILASNRLSDFVFEKTL